jgi:ppGpp synthetase/RelA/SpoT-type nucleotidyltranferase
MNSAFGAESAYVEGEASASLDDMARWAVPLHSKKQVNWAGATLVAQNPDVYDYLRALEIINNWRSAHGHPLNTFQTTLRIKGRQVDPHVVVAQRIKRLSSIESKLDRYPTMTLSQMQDIGGCRAIVYSVAQVQKLVQSYLKSEIKHRLHTHDDYMERPKPTGYRGVHLIYRYQSDKVPTYNSLKIEMQFRSLFQHAWATAVEIVGTFTRQALKSSQGEQEWLRFFSLMSTAIAMREGTTPVPDTPTNVPDLVLDLTRSAERLDAVRRLQTYGTAPDVLEDPEVRGNHFFLLELDIASNALRVTGYKNRELERASKEYLEAEKRFAGSTSADAVLVSVESLATLRRAYPNYFLDTNLFVELVQDALEGNFTDLREAA